MAERASRRHSLNPTLIACMYTSVDVNVFHSNLSCVRTPLQTKAYTLHRFIRVKPTYSLECATDRIAGKDTHVV